MSAGELLPTNKLTRSEFVLQPNQNSRMGNSGNSAVTTNGPSLYKLIVETEELNELDARLWKAWLERRNGREFTFTAWDLWYVNPQRAIGAADGSIGLTVDTAAQTLTMTGVGAYKASVGDMISYRTAANGYFAGRVQANVDAVGGNITVSVRPRPMAKHTTTPAVRRVQALAEFELSTDPAGLEPYSGRTLNFEGMQVTR